MAEAESCALLLLAAGGSRRMGEPKQLLDVDGEPMIRRVARTVVNLTLHPVVVVLGAHSERIREAVQDLPVEIIENREWQEGLASSLRVGTAAVLQTAPGVRGLIVMLADQPHLSTAHLEAIIKAHRESGRSIVASDYGDHLGPPAYFGAEYFPALQVLRGDQGARALLKTVDALAVLIPADAGADVDTSSDYARLVESLPVSR